MVDVGWARMECDLELWIRCYAVMWGRARVPGHVRHRGEIDSVTAGAIHLAYCEFDATVLVPNVQKMGKCPPNYYR